MDVYLDTSHLQKWCQRTLRAEELAFLETLRGYEHCTFVLSSTHIHEIGVRLDHVAALDVGRFLDTLRHKWLRFSNDIFSREVERAFEAFQNGEPAPQAINAFVGSHVDTLVGLDLEIYIEYRRASIERVINDLVGEQDILLGDPNVSQARLSRWSRLQARINQLLTNWRSSVKQRYKDVTAQILTNKRVQVYEELSEENQTFIDALVETPQWTPSHWLTFHSQHQCHRNINYVWRESDIGDVTHLSALPYVNQMTVDRRWYSYAHQALRMTPTTSPIRELSQRMNKSIRELMKKNGA